MSRRGPHLLPRRLTCSSKMMVGTLLSFWNGPLSGDRLIFGEVNIMRVLNYAHAFSKNNGKPIIDTASNTPNIPIQTYTTPPICCRNICCVSILLDRLPTCDLSSQTLGNFLSVCAILALTSGSAVNIFFTALIWKLPTWLVFSCLGMSHFRGDPRASDLTLFLYSQNLWLTKPSLRIRLTRSQKIENGLTVLSTRMILNDDFDQILEFFHQFASNVWWARRRGEVHEQAKDLWSLTVGHAVGHKLTSQWATTSSCIYYVDYVTSPQPTVCSEWNHGKEDACCILEASLSRTPVQALDLLPSYLCNPHRRCGRDGMEVGSVALFDSYVAVKSRLPDILVSRKDLQHANKA